MLHKELTFDVLPLVQLSVPAEAGYRRYTSQLCALVSKKDFSYQTQPFDSSTIQQNINTFTFQPTDSFNE
jgi:hypothetical protein